MTRPRLVRPGANHPTLGALVIVAIALLVVPGMLAPKPAPTAGPSPTAEPQPDAAGSARGPTPSGTLVFGLRTVRS